MIHAGDAMIRDFLILCDCQQLQRLGESSLFGVNETTLLSCFFAAELVEIFYLFRIQKVEL